MGSILIIPKDPIVCPEVPGKTLLRCYGKTPEKWDFSTINPTVLGISDPWILRAYKVGPLPVVTGFITPITRVIRTLSHLFSAIYRGYNSIYNWQGPIL